MRSRTEGDRVGQTDRKVRGSSGVRQIEVGTSQCAGQIARAIAVKVDVERRRGTASLGIFTHHAHCSDISVDARRWSGHDEVVSSLIIECLKCRLEVLRADGHRLLRCWVVVLIPKHSAIWEIWNCQNARAGVVKSGGMLPRIRGGALLASGSLSKRERNHAQGD